MDARSAEGVENDVMAGLDSVRDTPSRSRKDVGLKEVWFNCHLCMSTPHAGRRKKERAILPRSLRT